MKHFDKKLGSGFTIIELTIAIMIGMATGGMVLTLFNQQLAFLQLFKRQSFLIEEAPIINNYVSRVISKADGFRLHANRQDALLGQNSTPTGPAPVVVLKFRRPDGSFQASILEFAIRGGVRGLYYYLVAANGNVTEPEWAISKTPANIVFRVDAIGQPNPGVLQMVLTGPNQEQITYSGTTQ